MIKKTFAVPIVILLLSIMGFGFQQPGEWVTFKSAEGRFSITVPRTPEPRVSDVDSAVGKLQSYSFTSTSATANFLIGYGDYPNEPPADRVDAVLDGVRGGVLKGLDAELLTETKLVVSNRPAREFVATKTIDGVEYYFVWRYLLVGRRLYQVAVAAPKANLSSPEIQKFFTSFHLD